MGRIISEQERFETLCAALFGVEGGYADDPADRGGATNFGISLRFLRAEGVIDADHDGFADLDLDMDGDIDGADVRLLTRDQAKALYRRCFWDRFKCGALPAPLDGAVFDQAVNAGGVAAAKMLQRVCNRALDGMRHRMPLDVDGVIGPVTLAAVRLSCKRSSARSILHLYRMEAVARYETIAAADPTQRRFLDGWKRRALKLGGV